MLPRAVPQGAIATRRRRVARERGLFEHGNIFFSRGVASAERVCHIGNAVSRTIAKTLILVDKPASLGTARWLLDEPA